MTKKDQKSFLNAEEVTSLLLLCQEKEKQIIKRIRIEITSLETRSVVNEIDSLLEVVCE